MLLPFVHQTQSRTAGDHRVVLLISLLIFGTTSTPRAVTIAPTRIPTDSAPAFAVAGVLVTAVLTDDGRSDVSLWLSLASPG